MYAVIESGGKQYRVSEGQTLTIEKINSDAGADIHFEQVLLIADGDKIKVGKPYLDKAKVSASIVTQDRQDKIEIVKFKRRKHHLKRMGHRQPFTTVKIIKIEE